MSDRDLGESGRGERPPVFLTRRVNFCASHRYHREAWSVEKNREVFGPCNNPYGHGHNYSLEVTIGGTIDRETGMVMNLRDVDEVLRREVVKVFDHRFVNKEVPGFDTTVPTTENIAIYIWEKVRPFFDTENSFLERVRLYETPEIYADVLREEADLA
ncbi:MAG: 6-carboxytetrahydropterin synthase [Planctomycetota bacterium]